jgi:hypothetical protein
VPAAGWQLELPAQLDPARAAAALVAVADPNRLRGRLAEHEVGLQPALIEPVIAERHPRSDDRDRQVRPALAARVATDLEDVGRVVGQLELDLDRRGVLRVVDDAQPLLERLAGQQPLARDPERPVRQLPSLAALRGRVPVDARVREVDRAPEVAARGALQEHRTHTADAEDLARQDPGVAEVQPQPARVRVDVPERVGQQEQVLVLEHLDRAEVRRVDDRGETRLEVARLGRCVRRRSRLSRARHRSPRSRRAARRGRP